MRAQRHPVVVAVVVAAFAPVAMGCVVSPGFPDLDAIAPSVIEIDGEVIPLRQRHAQIRPGGGWFDTGAGVEASALTDDPRLPLALIFTAEAPLPGVYEVDNPFGAPRFKFTWNGVRLQAESGRFEIVSGAPEAEALFHVRSEDLVLRDACGTQRKNVRFELVALVEESLDHYWDHIVSPAFGYFDGALRVGGGEVVPWWGLLQSETFIDSGNERLLQAAGASACEIDDGWRIDLLVEPRDIYPTTHPTDGRSVSVLLGRHTLGELQQDQFLSIPLDTYAARQGNAEFFSTLDLRIGATVEGQLHDVELLHYVRDGTGAQVFTGQAPVVLNGRFRLLLNGFE